jgi:hypothetical protein
MRWCHPAIILSRQENWIDNRNPNLWSYLARGRKDIGDARMEVEFGNVSHQYLLFGQAEEIGGYERVHMILWLRNVI